VTIDANSGRDLEAFSGSAGDVSGAAILSIDVSNSTAFQVITINGSDGSGGQAAVCSAARIDDSCMATLSLTSPGGSTLLSSSTNSPPKTLALAVDTSVNSLNYRTQSADPTVVDGTYQQRIAFAKLSQSFRGFVAAKNDTDLNNGALRVNVFLVGADAQRERTRSAVTQAIAIWREIYKVSGRQIILDPVFIDLNSSSGILPNPIVGSSFYRDATSSSGIRAFSVSVFIGDDISQDGTTIGGNTFGPDVLGISAGIPGAAVSTVRTAVAVNLFAHAGADGILSNEDIDILGETLAHEVGHYLGLFHPVECVGSGADRCAVLGTGDSLADTASCGSLAACVANGLVDNVMFPTAVPGRRQRDMSTSQLGVLNQNVLVD